MVMRSDRFLFEILEIIFLDYSNICIDIVWKKENYEINVLIVMVFNM